MIHRKKFENKNLNLGEYDFITLYNANKEDILELISSLNNNINAIKQNRDVIQSRLKKCYEYFEQIGLSDDEIVKITQLDCEKY